MGSIISETGIVAILVILATLIHLTTTTATCPSSEDIDSIHAAKNYCEEQEIIKE